MIELTNIDHEYNTIAAKPNDQFHKIWLETSKAPIFAQSEHNPQMHEKMHVKLKINEKERV